MKTRITQNIDGYDIIIGIGDAFIDPIATIRYIQKQDIKITEYNRNELLQKHAIYLKNPTEELISDVESQSIIKKLEALNENELLSIKLESIPDYRGKQSYEKKDGKWITTNIELLNIVPSKMELTEQEQIEYNKQLEKERISSLTIEERNKEKEMLIDSIASQALQKEGMLRIKGISDYVKQAKDWFEQEKQKIEVKYK